MPFMKRLLLGVSLALGGCALSSKGQDVKTPDELIAEQERLGAEDEKERAAAADDYDTGEVEQTEDEKARQWDEKQAELELKRAARSAETCPDSVSEKAPAGTAQVTLVFQTSGHVKSSEIAAPYADTQ